MSAIAARVAGLDRAAEIASVIARLEAIESARDGFYNPPATADPVARAKRDPRPDGVVCFNGMYLCVTRAVAGALQADFEHPEFIHRLDVIFAEFYFEAVAAETERQWCSRAWSPLFEEALEQRILPLQFAVAGMNAHINNDLAYALVQAWAEFGLRGDEDTPEYRDYLKVNALLEAVETQIKVALLDPFIADVDHALGRVDDLLALWSIAKARQDAWDRAQKMRRHPDAEYDSLHDRLVGFTGHLLLSPLF
jgi:hypothetical protein